MPEALSSEGWTGPLSGLRVLDFGQAAVGPIAVEYLGWLGADAIKVESPRGDTVRGTRPSLSGTGHTFLGNNLGKRGVMLDLKDPEGHAQALRLIGSADVLVENFRSPEVMRRLGLGYELLREHNPRLIYLQSSAYGPRGPMHGMTSNEWFSQAAAGLTSVTGEAGGRQEFSRGTATLDWGGAFTNLQAILVALYVRERTGRGTFIQTSQLQSTIAGATSRIAEHLASGCAPGTAPGPMGSARPNIVPGPGLRLLRWLCRGECPPQRLLAEALRGSRPRQAARRPALRDQQRPRRAARRAAADPRGLLPRTQRRGVGAPPARGRRAGRRLPARPETLSASLLEHPQAIAEDLVTVLDTPYGAMASAEAALALQQDRGADRARRSPPRRAHRGGARGPRRRRRRGSGRSAPTATGARTHGCPSKACASSMSRRGSPARSARCSSATSARRW